VSPHTPVCVIACMVLIGTDCTRAFRLSDGMLVCFSSEVMHLVCFAMSGFANHGVHGSGSTARIRTLTKGLAGRDAGTSLPAARRP